MIKIGIVDDNVQIMNMLADMLREYFGQKGIGCKVECYQSPVFFCDEVIENQAYDICFLDVEMPEMNGMELALKLREKGSNVELVFLTAHPEFIRVGYQVQAFDYLGKEEVKKELALMMDRLLILLGKKKKRNYVIVNNFKMERFPFDDIVYVYKKGKYAQFVLQNREEKQERISLKDVINKLQGEEFMLIEKGYIVNLNHIIRIAESTVTMSDGTEIRVGRRYLMTLKAKIKEYWMGGK